MHRLLLGALMLAATLHSWSRRFLIDDAYIAFRYAANLVAGHGLVFNPGERVEGYSNFLWTLLMAAGLRAGLEPGMLSQAAGIAASAALLAVVWRWGRDRGLSPLWSLAAPAMLAVNRSYAVWATGGLETRLFSLLVVAGAWRLDREMASPRRRGAIPWSAVLLALACLTRPEGYLAAGVALAALVWRAQRDGDWPGVLRAAMVITAVCGAHEAWRIAYYGDWVPNSFRAKVAGPRFISGIVYLAVFAREHIMIPALVVAGTLAAARHRPRGVHGRFALPFVTLFAAYTLAVGGDHFEFRFVDVLLPFLALGAAGLCARATEAAPRAARAAAGALLVAAAAWPTLAGFQGVDRHLQVGGTTQYVSIVSVETEQRYLDYWTRIGVWLRDHAGPGESIAVTPAGVIPYLTGLRTLDMLGINDREIARGPALSGRNVGHEKRVESDAARARGITYLIADPVISIDPAPHPPRAVEVDFGDFRWYFLPLADGARIPPGSTWKAGS
jgi:arabinofuranosyltransferase